MENPFATWLEAWQTLASQSLDALANTSTVQKTVKQFFAGQEQILRLMKIAYAPFSAATVAPETAQEIVEAFSAQLRNQMVAMLEFWQSNAQLAELWQTYDQAWQRAAQPWFVLFAETPTLWSKAATEEMPDAFREFAVLLGNIFGAQWEQFLGAPDLGLAREFSRRQKKVYTHWLAYQRAAAEVQLMIGHATVDAITAFMQQLIKSAQEGKPLESERQWVDLWVEVADTRFLELFHSADYARAQGRLVNSGMALRLALRSVVESWLQHNDLPTRTELDETHHAIYELRREVRVLKRSLEQALAASQQRQTGQAD